MTTEQVKMLRDALTEAIRIMETLDTIRHIAPFHELDNARKALAATDPAAIQPAGEADWLMCERICNEDHVDDALNAFSQDITHDNAVGVIQAALTVYLADTAALAAPQDEKAEQAGELPRMMNRAAFVSDLYWTAYQQEIAELQAATRKSAPIEAGEMPPLPEPLEIDWPELHSQALGCGVEDRNLHNRYECAEYGWQDGVDRAIERVPDAIYDTDQMRAYGQLCRDTARPASSVTSGESEEWTPTAENINALPLPVRSFIHELAANCDPAGTVAQNVFLRDQCEGLQVMYRNAKSDPHWYDSPQSALGGKTAREGYAANPEYANQQKGEKE